MLEDRTRSRRRLSRRTSTVLGGCVVALVIASGTAAVGAATIDSDTPSHQQRHVTTAQQVALATTTYRGTDRIADFNAVRVQEAHGSWHDQRAPVLAKLRKERAHRRAAAKRAEHRRKVAARKAAHRRAGQSAPAADSSADSTPKPSHSSSHHASQPAPVTPSGSPQTIAKSLLGDYGWSESQFSCLQPLWDRESGWNVHASNSSSGAYGIPQDE